MANINTTSGKHRTAQVAGAGFAGLTEGDGEFVMMVAHKPAFTPRLLPRIVVARAGFRFDLEIAAHGFRIGEDEAQHRRHVGRDHAAALDDPAQFHAGFADHRGRMRSLRNSLYQPIRNLDEPLLFASNSCA